MIKKLTPLRKASLEFIKKYYYKTEAEARDIVENYSTEELRKYLVGVDTALASTIKTTSREVGLSIKEASDIISVAIDRDQKPSVSSTDNFVYSSITKLSRFGLDKEELAINCCKSIQDAFVNKHMGEACFSKSLPVPAELLGWDNISTYYTTYVRPFFETVGIKVNEQKMEEMYNRNSYAYLRNKHFLAEDGHVDVDTLATALSTKGFNKAIKDKDLPTKEKAVELVGQIVPRLESALEKSM